jgi:[ribosomal protein S18]-alanine N-acetyltransferase
MKLEPQDVGTPDLLLRPLSFGDLPAVMEIERSSFSTPWRMSTFEGLLARPDSDVIGATRTGHLVGYCVVWTIGDQAELGNVAVKEAERGGRIGRKLVEAALVRARERGARECFLEVRESNHHARNLYEKCGFRMVGRRRNYYSKPVEDALVLRSDLI